MPAASEQTPLANEPSSSLPERQSDAASVTQAFVRHSHGASQSVSPVHAHGVAHDHSLPHSHGTSSTGLNGLQVQVSPVLAGVWARIFTTLAILGPLWLAILWAFVGNV